MDKALEIESHLQFGLKVEFSGRQWAYSDFCGAQCENSDVVQIFFYYTEIGNNIKLKWKCSNLFKKAFIFKFLNNLKIFFK